MTQESLLHTNATNATTMRRADCFSSRTFGWWLLLACSSFANVQGRTPQVSIAVREGIADGLQGLDPTLTIRDETTWDSGGGGGEVTVQYGVQLSVPTTARPWLRPRLAWAKATGWSMFGDWGMSARADVDCQHLGVADVEVNGRNKHRDLSVRVTAETDTIGETKTTNNPRLRGLECTKGWFFQNARWTVTPRVDWVTQTKDVVVTYATPKLLVKGTALLSSGVKNVPPHELTLSYQLDDSNRIAPTISSTGQWSVAWEKLLGRNSNLLLNITPRNCVSGRFEDDSWTANVVLPLFTWEEKTDGAMNVWRNAVVHVQRKVQF